MSDEQWAHIMNLVHSYSPFHTLTEWYIQQMKNITSWLDAHVFILHTKRVLNYNFLIRLVGTWTKKVDPDSGADILEFRLCPSNGWCISLERSRFSLKTYTYLFIYLFICLHACAWMEEKGPTAGVGGSTNTELVSSQLLISVHKSKKRDFGIKGDIYCKCRLKRG